MNRVLAILIAFVFLQTQVWALSGGPVFVTTGNTDLTGVYSGAMVETSQLAPPPTPLPGGSATTAAIGTFSITVPIAGAATGTIVYFQGNTVYTGTINAAADDLKRTIVGIIQATSNSLFITTPVTTVTQITVIPSGVVGVPPTTVTTTSITPAVTTPLTGQGFMQAKISGPTSTTNAGNAGFNGVSRNVTVGGVDSKGNPVSLGNKGDRLSGTATIDVVGSNIGLPTAGPAAFVAQETKFSLSGVRETNAIATAAAAPAG
jgi:hypothetical protein